MELNRNEMVGQESSWGLPDIGSRLLCCWLSSGAYKLAARNVRKESWMNIYVGQLPYSVTEDELRAMFTEFGELENVKIITDRYTGQSKGFGFVEMPSNSEADRAIKALNGKFINGRNIKVNPADPGGKRSKRSRRSFSRDRY
jgi:RNA recognition motif-containing protein